MCGGQTYDFTCEHLPKLYRKTAENFQIRTGEKTPFESYDHKSLVENKTISMRLCQICAKEFKETMKITNVDNVGTNSWAVDRSILNGLKGWGRYIERR
jgi:hypothetical protein